MGDSEGSSDERIGYREVAAPAILRCPLSPSSAGFGFEGESDLLKLAVTNEPAAALFSPHWHASGEALAFTPILQRRFFEPVCIWVAGESAIKVLEPRSLKPLLPTRYPAWGTTSEFLGWEGNKAMVRIYDCQDPDRAIPPNDPGVRISYDIRTGKLAREDLPTQNAR